jgi:hypothetical protein
VLRRKVLQLLENGSSYQQKMDQFPFTALDVIRKRIMVHTKCHR